MSSILSTIKRTPFLGKPVIFVFRLWIIINHIYQEMLISIKWLLSSSETTNLTYDLSDINKQHLAAMLSLVTGQSYETLFHYILELENDLALATHIREQTLASIDRAVADSTARYGRRLGWYALVRAMKPKIVVETGVDKGLGACVITAALKRNTEEGKSGRYFGTDIKPDAGYLLKGVYSEYGEVLHGDSAASLAKFDNMIDLFINDSDHSAEYETLEYKIIQNKLSADSIIIGDNSHVTNALLNFAKDSGRQFLFFAERPINHWCRGTGIGIAFKPKSDLFY